MKKLFLTISLAMMLVLAACGGADNDTDNQDNAGDNNDQETNELADENTQIEGNEETGENEQIDDNEATNENEGIEVELANGDGDSIGTATLEEVSEGVEIVFDGHDIPSGTHAFHIHEKGVCEEPDFKSAGGHFNPDDTNHGFDDPDGPHAGDMPNIEVAEDGTVHQSYVAENVTLEEGEDNSLLNDEGTSLVIHEGADDGKSQPSGDAGDRIACGVIER